MSKFIIPRTLAVWEGEITVTPGLLATPATVLEGFEMVNYSKVIECDRRSKSTNKSAEAMISFIMSMAIGVRILA